MMGPKEDAMNHRMIRLASLWLLGLGLVFVLAACAGPPGSAGPAGPQGPAGPAGPAGPPGPSCKSFVVPGEGVKVEITGVEFPADGKPVVALTITDAEGRPLAAKVLEGHGFTIAQIVVDEATGLSKYQNLLVRDVQGRAYTVAGESKQPALAKATQPFADSGGMWSDEG